MVSIEFCFFFDFNGSLGLSAYAPCSSDDVQSTREASARIRKAMKKLTGLVAENKDVAEWSVTALVCVEDTEGTGLGRKMLRKFQRRLRERGVQFVGLDREEVRQEAERASCGVMHLLFHD